MTLVDTSAWIDHFRRADSDLVERLQHGAVACHPFVIGELALGSLVRRSEILELVRELHTLSVMPHEGVLTFVVDHVLAATGIGWVDAHLLAAAHAAGAEILTHDRRLQRQAIRLGLASR